MNTILIVDDTESSRDLLSKLLRKQGYQTVCAGDGLEALAAVEEHRPALILLDIMMPVMDGVEFLRTLRQDPQRGGLPVIAVTACSDNATLERMAQLGVFDYMVKSRFSITVLLERVRQALSGGLEQQRAPGMGLPSC